MGVGAIVTFGSISGSVSSVEYKDHLHHGTGATGHAGPGSPHLSRGRGLDRDGRVAPPPTPTIGAPLSIEAAQECSSQSLQLGSEAARGFL